MIKQPPYCAFQMQKGKQSLRHKEKLFPSFIIFYTLKTIKVYNKTSLCARRFEAYQSVFCKRSNVSSSLDSLESAPELASLSEGSNRYGWVPAQSARAVSSALSKDEDTDDE